MTPTQSLRIGRRTLTLHRQDKTLLPADETGDPITKGDLVGYYREIAPYMLPHLRGRPLMLERLPDGLDGSRIMQKNVPSYFPDWVHRVKVPKEGGSVVHPVCEDTATLVYLADQAAVTLHRWQSKASDIRRPDRVVFDLDPSGDDDFEAVRAAARQVRELLDSIGLASGAMTTGSRGLHVVAVLRGGPTFDDVHDFSKEAADTLAAAHPGQLTTAARKADRGTRLYLDVQRNAYAQTAVVPYTVRAKPGAPVATPISWDQLDDPGLTARRWTVHDALDQARTNPWGDLARKGRALGPARDALRELKDERRSGGGSN
ncbi:MULTISPECIES: non-homologous end-joining DNA ligase [unclassified Streptomyces]|uniref:non-homologous end-joining DNA ligase n=1 Tax=unclassified Streptomyces TaxID=2593676 RepID=UPI000DB97D88|nr:MULTISPECIES: non-homologous end-joining DNA ligase [unclassified Streptomyces]MYT74935.1 ATP-dependent DNA ligase [Streptomyces sp. SID8367]RAJ91927.1 bifunctional non-homologous end joining protein LigD [Streptomyces sp. PsTaAH-137]